MYLSVFSLNAGKYGPEKLRIRSFLRSFISGIVTIESVCVLFNSNIHKDKTSDIIFTHT